MKISVITVCYNAASTLERTIRSVLEQSYPNIEYIVIDGNSTDGTCEIIKRYSDRVSKFISEPDRGIYDAMNKGIALAEGDYINFMNAGDVFSSPDAIRDVVELADKNADVIYGYSTVVLPNGKKKISPCDSFDLIKKRPIYRHNASFTKTSLHKQYPFDLTKSGIFKYALDYDNIFRLFSIGANFQKVDVDVVTWDKEGTSDNPIRNVKLTFKISHQFRKPTLKEYAIYFYDIIKACRRELLKRL